MLLPDGWAEGEALGMDVRGSKGFSSLMKQNKNAKIYFVIYIAGFFFLKFSVMKCLRSKKRLNAADYTTSARPYIPRAPTRTWVLFITDRYNKTKERLTAPDRVRMQSLKIAAGTCPRCNFFLRPVKLVYRDSGRPGAKENAFCAPSNVTVFIIMNSS